MYDPFADFSKFVLTNGLEVHSMYLDRPWIGVEIVVHSGGREDPTMLPGLAHFVEHVVSKNIPGRNVEEVKTFFEICGGKVWFGSTDYYSTQYRFFIPADPTIFREALAIIGAMLLEAQIKEGIESERKIIEREFYERYPFPEKMEWDLSVRKALFAGHRLETWNRPLGRPEGFLHVTGANLQAFYDENYVPVNISMVTIGGIPNDDVVRELERSPFGIQKSGRRIPIPPPFKHISVPFEQMKIVRFSDHVSFKVGRTEYSATWAFPADYSRQTLVIFSQMLRKILFDEIRQKRSLAYDIDVSYRDFQDVYEYEVSGRIVPEATSYIGELVRNCILSVPKNRELFDQERNSSLQKCSMIDFSGLGLANCAAEEIASGHRIILMEDVWNDLQKVTFEQMAEVALLLSPYRQYTFIVRP